MSSNTLALCQQSLSVPLTPQNYDCLRSSHLCRLGHDRLPNSIKIAIRKRVLPDDKVHDGGETDSPGNSCCCGSWKHGSPRHIDISIYFWQKSWAEIDCKRSVIQSVREQKREKEWETRTNLGFEISQVPFSERSCKEYILCICTPPALQPPLWSLTSPISGSLVLYFFCILRSSGFILRAQIR
jgi:hypothetical protein